MGARHELRRFSSMSRSSYKDLIAWQKGMELVAAIYDATEGFPSREQFGLVSQLRRAAVSVPSNIAREKLTIPIAILCDSFALRAVLWPRSKRRC